MISINVEKLNVENFITRILRFIIIVRNRMRVFFHPVPCIMGKLLKVHLKIEGDQELKKLM